MDANGRTLNLPQRVLHMIKVQSENADGSLAVAVSETSCMETGKIFEARSFWRAARALSASTIPEFVLPLISSAVYSNTGICNHL